MADAWRDRHGTAYTEADIDVMYEDSVPREIRCIGDYADLLPGTLEAQKNCRDRILKIGTTTGYSSDMAKGLIPLAEKQGYRPDSNVTASNVPMRRPAHTAWLTV